MTKQTNTSFKLATVLWFGVTAALLGFATVYIALKLAGNMISPEGETKTVTTAPSTLIPNYTNNKSKVTDNATGKDTGKPNLAPSGSKAGAAANSVKNIKNNTTEIAKKTTMPVNLVTKDKKGNPLVGLNKGEMAALLIRANPMDVPDFDFVALDQKPRKLTQWKGKVVLLNIWATWCVPCRAEMPDLDRLKGILGKENFDVVTINIDKGGLRKPTMFFQRLNIRNLALYGATSSRLTTLLRAPGLPATLLIGKDGKEIARLIGPARWASNDAVAVIKAAIAMP